MIYRGLDTETDEGKAVLLGTPSRFLLFPRTFLDIYLWLRNEPFEDQAVRTFCAYNLDYDAKGILKFLPRAVLYDLDFHGRAVYQDFFIRYIPNKLLTINRKKDAPLIFYDCFQFYRVSLQDASQSIFGEGKVEIPRKWLLNMAWALKDKKKASLIIKYCMKDALLCEKLMFHLQVQFRIANLDFSKPISAGSLAFSTFKDRMVPDKSQKISQRVQEFHRSIYYGGRIEVYKRGYFKRAQVWDINSAYPYALSKFYAPWVCSRKEGRTFTNHRVMYGMYKVKVSIPLTPISPVPWIPEGGTFDPLALIYPVGIFTTWVDRYTMELLIRKHWIDTIYFSIEWIKPRYGNLWFPEIPALYLERKKNPEVSLAIKLTLNSLYGKFAESIRVKTGTAKVDSTSEYYDGKFYRTAIFPTKHTSFLVAGHITGFTRKMLFETMEEIGYNHLIGCHTDGIITLPCRGPSGQGDALGEWKLDHNCTGFIMVGAGVYAFKEKAEWQNRMRGFSTTVNLIDRLRAVRHRKIIKIVLQRVPTLRETIQSNEFSKMNQFVKTVRILNVNFDEKRQWEKDFTSASQVLTTRHESWPLIVS